jgi:hypothetical protein
VFVSLWRDRHDHSLASVACSGSRSRPAQTAIRTLENQLYLPLVIQSDEGLNPPTPDYRRS